MLIDSKKLKNNDIFLHLTHTHIYSDIAFILLIDVKIPTIVDILTFMS